MNLLLINHYAGSPRYGMEYRPYYLAREWTRLGHRVTIAAASYSHLRTRSPEVTSAVAEETVDGVRYVWLKTPSYEGNGLRRALNIFAFAGQLLARVSRIAEARKFDAIICSSVHMLDTLPGARLAAEHNARLVFEVHDLWPLSLVELGGMSWNHPFVLLLSCVERCAYRRADRVVSILPMASEYMQSRGMAPEKFVHVSNGVDCGEWSRPGAALPPEHARILRGLKAAGRFLVCYAGEHGTGNGLTTLIEAAGLLQDHPVTLVLVGQGSEKARLQGLVEERCLGNVVFLPPVARQCMPTLLAAMDVLYVGARALPLLRFGISPNKLMDYMMAAKPVINAVRAGNDMVAESGCGVTISPDCPQATAGAVLKLVNLGQARREEMGRCGQEYVRVNHDYPILARRFLDGIGEKG